MYCIQNKPSQNLRAKNNNSLFLMTLSWQGSAGNSSFLHPGVEGPFIKLLSVPQLVD